jgi:hypothetical protein
LIERGRMLTQRGGAQVLIDDRGHAVERGERVDVPLPADGHVVRFLAGPGNRVDRHVDVRAGPAAATRAALARADAPATPP